MSAIRRDGPKAGKCPGALEAAVMTENLLGEFKNGVSRLGWKGCERLMEGLKVGTIEKPRKGCLTLCRQDGENVGNSGIRYEGRLMLAMARQR